MILKDPSRMSQEMDMTEQTKQKSVKIFDKSLHFLIKILITINITLQGLEAHILEKF